MFVFQSRVVRMAFYFLVLMPISLAIFTFATRGSSWGGIQQLHLPSETEFQAENCINNSKDDQTLENVFDQTASGVGFLPEYASWNLRRPHTQISLATTTSVELEDLLPWILYHRVLGVDTMYIFVEGKANTKENCAILQNIPGVKVFPPSRTLREKQFRSHLWKSDNVVFDTKYRPCLYQRYIRQTLNLAAATSMARRAGMKWIVHLGVDELLFPGGGEMHHHPLVSTFDSVDDNVDIVIFPHYEGVVERDDIKEPFTEVTLFRRSPTHLTGLDVIDAAKKMADSKSHYFLGFQYGRAAARLQHGLHPDGPHRWSHTRKMLRGTTMDEAVVLHYTYTKFSDLTAMRNVCDCRATPRDAIKCFSNDFDRAAFIAAETLADKPLFDWFRDHIVWTNRTLLDVLIRRSIFVRIQIVQIIIEGLRGVGQFQDVIEAGKRKMEMDESLERFLEKERKRSTTRVQHRERSRNPDIYMPSPLKIAATENNLTIAPPHDQDDEIHQPDGKQPLAALQQLWRDLQVTLFGSESKPSPHSPGNLLNITQHKADFSPIHEPKHQEFNEADFSPTLESKHQKFNMHEYVDTLNGTNIPHFLRHLRLML